MRSIAALVLLSTALFLPAPASAEEAAWLAGDMVQVAAHRTDHLPLPRTSSEPLMGYLARPDEPGRHPAVIELHGCGGFGTMDVVVADVLKSFGYVALALDSLGDANVCEQNSGDGEFAEAFDAYAALDWLAEQSYVDSTTALRCLASRWAAARPSTLSNSDLSKTRSHGTSVQRSPIIPGARIGLA